MSKYISVDDIPGNAGKRNRYPYDEWVKIPDGKAVEVTELLDGVKIQSARNAIHQYISVHRLPLRTVSRGERLFIVRDTAKKGEKA